MICLFMGFLNKKETLALFLGDIGVLTISLWLSLLLRFKEMPSWEVFSLHFGPFFILSLIWCVCFFIAGLYETHRVIIRNKLPEILIKTQVANAVIAITFFYLFSFGITPKIILSIFLGISLLCIVVWRIAALYLFISKKKRKAILFAQGKEAEELFIEVNKIARHNFEFTTRIDPASFKEGAFQDEVTARMKQEGVNIIVFDSLHEDMNTMFPKLYTLGQEVQFIDFYKLYGEVFYRMPLGMIQSGWFIQHTSLAKHGIYDVLKRVLDIAISIPLLVVSIPFIALAAIALKIQDGGEVFGVQNRVGQFGKIIKILKLRTMLFNDNGKWKDTAQKNEVTKVGRFLRKTRIDELPQVINVLKGDVSLIGPRPEFPQAVTEYINAIPFYNARHTIKPGLSGWAQIYHETHPHHGIDIEETKNKLAYDLFYIKNRSIVLDIMIALKTIKTFLSREGR